MEFSTTGAQCHHCRQRDYLPFTCKYCSNQYCLSHRTADSHECTSLAEALAEQKQKDSSPPPPPSNLPVKYKCHHQGCKIRELQPIHCRNCGHSHCIKHRFPTSHACEAFGSRNGVSRNTILPAGVVAARPIDANGSTDSSTQPIAPLPAAESAPRFTAAQFTSAITSFFASAAASSTAVTSPVLQPAESSSTASIASSSSSAPPVAVAAVESSPLMLRNVSGANSCAAEVAASAAAMSSSSIESSISTSSTTSAATSSAMANINSESTSSSVPTTARRTNTNVAHLSKLLKQRS